MATHAMKSMIAAVALSATASLSTAALAQDADCTRWDRTDSFRRFECLNRVWTGDGWRLVNTCPRRSTVPNGYWGYAR